MGISLLWASLLLGCGATEISFQMEGSRVVDVGTSVESTNDWTFTFDVFEAYYSAMGVRSAALGTGAVWLDEEGPWDTDLTPDNGPFEIGVLEVDAQTYDRGLIQADALLVEGKASKASDTYTFFFTLPLDLEVLCVQDLDLSACDTAEVVSTWHGEQLFRTVADFDGGEIDFDPWVALLPEGGARRFTEETLLTIGPTEMEAAGLDLTDTDVTTMWDWLVLQATLVPRIGDPCR